MEESSLDALNKKTKDELVMVSRLSRVYMNDRLTRIGIVATTEKTEDWRNMITGIRPGEFLDCAAV